MPLGRPEDPLYITIQTKKAASMERWENKVRIQMLPSSTWGRMSDIKKDAHMTQGID